MKARLPAGFNQGGQGNMNNIIKQAQKMQEDMAALQSELEEREYEVTGGGGAIKVVMTGKKRLKSVEITPEVIDPDDIEMLQDIIVAAVNEAADKVEAEAEKEMASITGGMNLPGMF
ncbi:MAG: YbaB/EbfC family nucleoid-associated protein [Bacillota bacterium]|nr:YbaB/EbfC family nucleoid-associated protein [Bacillota bacterium]